MNREIKFRGIPINGGDYVYGSFIDYPAESIIISWEEGSTEVEPNSVSQFTGLLDIDLVEIYDGDTIEFEYNIGGKVRGTIEWAKGGYYNLKTEDTTDSWCYKVIPAQVKFTKIWK